MSIPTLNSSLQILMPRQKKQANFLSHTKTRWFSSHPQKRSQFHSLHWNQVNFDPSHWNQVNIDHLHTNEFKFEAHTKNKRCSARIPQASQFRPPTGQNKKLNRYAHKNQLIFGPHRKNNTFAISSLKPSQSWSILQNQMIIGPHTKTKLNFDPPHKNEVNFDTHTKTKSISIPTLMSSRFRCPDTKNGVNFDPYTRKK